MAKFPLYFNMLTLLGLIYISISVLKKKSSCFFFFTCNISYIKENQYLRKINAIHCISSNSFIYYCDNM